MKHYIEPCFVDFVYGNTTCVVRFYAPEEKAEFLEMVQGANNSGQQQLIQQNHLNSNIVNEMNNMLYLKSNALTIEEITGQEEVEYLNKVSQKKLKLKRPEKK